jgi:hypothetical protein
VRVDGAVERLPGAPARDVHQRLAAEHTPGMLGQRREQIELSGG